MIENCIRPGSRILDLGCGDGGLLYMLAACRRVFGLGMEIDLENMLAALKKGLDVFQCDLDEGLHMIPDLTYDYAILSETLQVVRKPQLVLREMLRVARAGIVSFPNFGNWRTRLRLLVSGRMPVSRTLPFAWYDTPNIHLFTLRDFEQLCAEDHIRIVDVFCTAQTWLDAVLLKLGGRNLGADRVIITIARQPSFHPEHQTSNTEHLTPHPDHLILNTEHRTLNTEHRTPHTEHHSTGGKSCI